MNFVRGGDPNTTNVTIEKLIWWPYKSMRGNLTLEMKMTRMSPTEVVAVTLDTRSFSHQIGKTPLGLLDDLKDGIGAFSSQLTKNQSSDAMPLEQADEVLPSFNQLIADLASSISTLFIRRVAVTERLVSYSIASGGDAKAKLLIEAGAYEMAIERLQEVTAKAKQAEDMYNLGLSFEAVGEYGIAATSYREALAMDQENLLFAQGVGRIERLLRENPALRRQLAQKQ